LIRLFFATWSPKQGFSKIAAAPQGLVVYVTVGHFLEALVHNPRLGELGLQVGMLAFSTVTPYKRKT
jgi:hypothetical protein